MAAVDVTSLSAGSSYVSASKNSISQRNTIGKIIGSAESFGDDWKTDKIDKCYQFGSTTMGAMTSSISGECSSNILDNIGSLLKNNAVVQFINTSIGKVNNAIDGVKSFGKTVIGAISNSKMGLKLRSFYCGTLAPAMQILLMVLKALIAIPLTILNALYKIIQKIKDIANSLTKKLFDCFNSFLGGMQDSVGQMSMNYQFKLNDLFSFLDDVDNFLANCEIISRPLIDSFNQMINPCSPTTARPFFDAIGMTTEGVDEPILCSAEDLRALLARRKKNQEISTNALNDFLNRQNPFSGVFNGAKALNELTRAYTQNGIAQIYAATMTPLHGLETRYNNLLSARSSILGRIVNSTIGWLFPDCGSGKFEDGIIKRRKYSIKDVINILDSMNGCNSYICGGINNQVSELLAQLELSKWGRWINPLVKSNENLTKFINNIYAETFGSNAEIANTKLAGLNINSSFIKKILPYSLTLKAVY